MVSYDVSKARASMKTEQRNENQDFALGAKQPIIDSLAMSSGPKSGASSGASSAASGAASGGAFSRYRSGITEVKVEDLDLSKVDFSKHEMIDGRGGRYPVVFVRYDGNDNLVLTFVNATSTGILTRKN